MKLDIFEVQAAFCGIFSSPVRLKIMWFLGDGEKSVGEIAEYLGISVPSVSQHLRIMRDKNALRTRKDGRQVFYHISNPKFMQGAKLIREGLLEELKKCSDAA